MQKAWEDDYEQTSGWYNMYHIYIYKYHIYIYVIYDICSLRPSDHPTYFLSVPGKQERQGLEVGISMAESEVLLLKEDFLQKNLLYVYIYIDSLDYHYFTHRVSNIFKHVSTQSRWSQDLCTNCSYQSMSRPVCVCAQHKISGSAWGTKQSKKSVQLPGRLLGPKPYHLTWTR